MREQFNDLLNTPFLKNVVTLMTGTALAQALPISISPILTRIYTPEDFGIFALYLSISSILGVVVSGRYELAIVLPEKDDDAINIVALSALIALGISLFVFLIVIIFNDQITFLLKTPEISNWLYFIPATIFISGIYRCLYYWNNRQEKYMDLSKSRVISTGTNSLINLGFGVLNLGVIGLVLGNVLGQFFASFFLISNFFKKQIRETLYFVNFLKIKEMGKRYKDFLKYDSIAAFFNLSSNQSTHLFFNIIFNAVTSGYFYLTQKILAIPILLISSAIQDVFRIEMIKLYNEKGNTRKLFIKALKQLTVIALFPSLVLYFFSVELFSFFFGEEWKVSGEFARIMIPIFFFRFISFPLSYMVYIAEKQFYNTIAQISLFILVLLSFYIGNQYDDAIFTVKLLTVSYTLFYITYLIISYLLTDSGKSSIDRAKPA